MILVINLNASLDKRYALAELTKGEVMRADSVQNTPGGKGLHVANVATILGADTIATGFLGGKTGEFIAEALAGYGIRHDFVKIAGETRSCLAIITADGAQTEILEPGPPVSDAELKSFREKYAALLPSAEVVVASGSIPQDIDKGIYADLITAAKAAGKKFLLDTSGEALKLGIAAQPYFIKPNKDEIEALRGHRVDSEAEVIHEVKNFLAEGIGLAAVSLGADGSIVGCGEQLYRVTVPRIKAVNPVGSGDSYVAGIAVGLSRGLEMTETLRLSAAAGTANAMEAESGFVRKSTVETLLTQIKVEAIDPT
ncbi:MAG: 1-phosphofructokinase family hexose kinase [Selenomonadaceae bacterium]|nr:1-phosphofructokinase family hexose kinase [Selenomonadaceae bacterium]